jgi:hypothetical protein
MCHTNYLEYRAQMCFTARTQALGLIRHGEIVRPLKEGTVKTVGSMGCPYTYQGHLEKVTSLDLH